MTGGEPPPRLPARRSAVWNVAFRVMYRGLRILAPVIGSMVAAGSPGLDGVVELRFTGRRSGRPRRTLVTLLTVDGRWYVGHPNGSAAWIRNIEDAGVVEIEPPGALGSRFRVERLADGPERDAVIRATWTQQPFPANLLYRAARRHVAAVGVYHRLEPIRDDGQAAGDAGAPSVSPAQATSPTT
jgi:F420H(2)-dependent quinone reductase